MQIKSTKNTSGKGVPRHAQSLEKASPRFGGGSVGGERGLQAVRLGGVDIELRGSGQVGARLGAAVAGGLHDNM